MKYFTLNRSRNITFNEEFLKVVDEKNNIKLKGDQYIKYIFPLRKSLYKVNSAEALFEELKMNEQEEQFIYDDFIQILDKLVMLKVLILCTVGCSERKKSTNFLNSSIAIVVFLYHDYYREIYNRLEQFFESNIEVILIYDEGVKDYISTLKSEEKEQKCHFLLFSEKDRLLDILEKSDIVISVQFQLDSMMNQVLSEWAKKERKKIVYCTFLEKRLLIGPIQDERGDICMKCVLQNEFIKKNKEDQEVVYREKLDSFTLDYGLSILIREIIFYCTRSYSRLQASLITCNAGSYNCQQVQLTKFGDCLKCSSKHLYID